MNRKTRKLAITSLLTALTFLLGLTIIGYPPNPLLPVFTLTLMCLPVIIGTIVEGLKTGLLLSFIFGITSYLKALGFTLVPDTLGTLLLGINAFKTLVVIFVPRLLIPVTTWLVFKAITGDSKLRQRVATGVAAFVGSITNTVLFLGAVYLLFLPEISEVTGFLAPMGSIVGYEITANTLFSVYAFLGAINGLPEAIVAVLLCVPIVWALTKYRNKGVKKTEI